MEFDNADVIYYFPTERALQFLEKLLVFPFFSHSEYFFCNMIPREKMNFYRREQKKMTSRLKYKEMQTSSLHKEKKVQYVLGSI